MSKPIGPWELLREARESVQLLANKLHNELDYAYSEEQEQLCSRIDAALAERAAGRNCKRGCPDCGHPTGGLAYCQNTGHTDDFATIAAALRASCAPGCSHEGEWVDLKHETEREEAYHKGFIALGDVRCGYCGADHRKDT